VATHSSSQEESPFRDNIPVYRPPDRAAWEANSGKAPFELTDVEPRYALQAKGRIERDLAEINRGPAITNATVLDEICEGVLYRSGLDATMHIIHFDTGTNSFWAYPL